MSETATIGQLPSIAASVSVTFAVMTVFLIFLGPAAIVTAFLAIIFGFYAKSNIRKSEGRLSGSGKASFGFWFGGLFLVLSLLLLPAMRMQSVVAKGWWKSVQVPASMGTPIAAAEHSLMTTEGSGELGNSIQASGMSGGLKGELSDALNAYFDGVEQDQRVTVYCRKDDESCCFLVYIPDLGSFDNAAKDAVSHLAWDSAQRVSGKLQTQGSKLAVAIRDVYRYRSIQVGEVPARRSQSDPGLTTVDETMLEPFFQDDEG
jgi:uncharacterized membrane protein YhaH (DUF805 family)